MNCTTIRINIAKVARVAGVAASSVLLGTLLMACGNKGELYLETDLASSDEIRQLDESLEELDEESETKPAKKKDTNSSQTTE